MRRPGYLGQLLRLLFLLLNRKQHKDNSFAGAPRALAQLSYFSIFFPPHERLWNAPCWPCLLWNSGGFLTHYLDEALSPCTCALTSDLHLHSVGGSPRAGEQRVSHLPWWAWRLQTLHLEAMAWSSITLGSTSRGFHQDSPAVSHVTQLAGTQGGSQAKDSMPAAEWSQEADRVQICSQA